MRFVFVIHHLSYLENRGRKGIQVAINKKHSTETYYL